MQRGYTSEYQLSSTTFSAMLKINRIDPFLSFVPMLLPTDREWSRSSQKGLNFDGVSYSQHMTSDMFLL